MRDIRKPTLPSPDHTFGADRSEGRPAIPPKPKQQKFTGTAVPVSAIHLPTTPVTATAQSPHSLPRIGYKERKLLFGIFSLVVVAALLAAFIFLPSAHIALILRTAPLLVDEKVTIRATQGGDDPSYIPGAAFFREIQLEGTAPVTSQEMVGEKAKGTVQIVNQTGSEQKIKERSRLVTKDGQLFYMTKHAIIPPNSSSSVEVEAAEAGEAANIQPQRLSFAALPAETQSVLYAENKSALTGGTGQLTAVVRDSDLEEAQTSSKTAARQRAEAEIRQELPKDWVILEESWTTEPKQFETQVKVGDQTAAIPYTTRMVVRVLGFEKRILEERLTQALSRNLSREYMLFPGPLSYTTTVDKTDWEQGIGEVTIRVTHTTIPQLSVPALKDKLSGRSREEAKTYLQGLPGVQSATVSLSPFWVQSIPRIDRRIMIDLQPERQP